MTWQSPERSRERILLYGMPGGGKSKAVLSIAQLVTPHRVYVLDTEVDTYERLLYGTGIDNVIPYGVLPEDWERQMNAVREIGERVEEDDWFVIDSISPTWPAVTSWYVDRVFNHGIADHFLAAREAAKGGNPLDGWKDYSVINAQYAQLYNLCLRASLQRRCHLLWTAEGEALRDDAPREKQLAYRGLGVEPRGQKRLGHIPHTVIYMRRDRSGWGWQTVKDQGARGEVDGEVKDFGRQYLGGVAGWRPAVGGDTTA